MLIIAEDIDEEALNILVVNRLNIGFQVLAVKASSFGDRRKSILQDFAILTDALVIGDDTNSIELGDAKISDLGQIGEIVVTQDTLIIGGEEDKKDINRRIEQIRDQIDDTTSEYDRATLQERLAKLAGGVAVINVGSSTEIELKEKKLIIGNARRAALEEGIVPGGGVSNVNIVVKGNIDPTKVEFQCTKFIRAVENITIFPHQILDFFYILRSENQVVSTGLNEVSSVTSLLTTDVTSLLETTVEAAGEIGIEV